ncbi:MAG: flagellar synthesis regulator FleN [Desulfobacteraceae bacterium]|nr:MAG: flagellar synthesis regulator FleN [Desulfobacteraceae bacterium]
MDQATGLRRMVKGKSDKIYRLRRDNRSQSFSSQTKPRVIAITSGKGGVGKTNAVGNVAIACQRMGKKVLIFDADLGLANIDIIFGLNPKYTIAEVIKGEKGLSQIIVTGPEGVAVMPASSGVQELVHLTEGQKINLLNEFDTLNNNFDILLIDTGAGISSNVIYFNLAAQERIVIVTPEPTSITDAYALMKVMFREHGTKSFLLLVNMVEDEKEARSVYQNLSKVVARFMGGISIDYAGFIPWDSCLQESVTRREPVVCCYPESSSSKSFKELAHYLVKQTDRRPIDGNIKFFWNRLMAGMPGQGNEGRD